MTVGHIVAFLIGWLCWPVAAGITTLVERRYGRDVAPPGRPYPWTLAPEKPEKPEEPGQ